MVELQEQHHIRATDSRTLGRGKLPSATSADSLYLGHHCLTSFLVLESILSRRRTDPCYEIRTRSRVEKNSFDGAASRS
jgi:hypothetical protein